MEHGLCQPESLEHAFGVLGDVGFSPVGESDGIEQFASSSSDFGDGEAAEAPVEFERGVASQVPGYAVSFGQVADSLSSCFATGRFTQQCGFAGGFVNDAEQHLDQCGLAGSVGSEQSEDLALADFERHALECLDFPSAEQSVVVGFDEIGDTDDRF